MEYLLKSQFPTCQKLFIKQPAEKHCKTENGKDREEWVHITTSLQKQITLTSTEKQITW